MGTCASRERELREKLCFSESEFDRCQDVFKKLTDIKPGRPGFELALEGFKSKFPENPGLAQKVFKWIESQNVTKVVDFPTFATSIEMLAKTSHRIHSSQMSMLRSLQQGQLLLIISMDQSQLYNASNARLEMLQSLQVSFLTAGVYLKEVVNMTGGNSPICQQDDHCVILFLERIFEGKSTLDMQTFYQRLTTFVPNLTRVVKSYFETKFLSKFQQVSLPRLVDIQNKAVTSDLISLQQLAMIYLSTQWFNKVSLLTRIYRFDSGNQPFNFNKLANSLLQCNCPTIILFKHVDPNSPNNPPHIFGFMCVSSWRVSPDITGKCLLNTRGDHQCCIFTLSPHYRLFPTYRNAGQSKFALIIPIITKRTSQNLSTNRRLPKTPGLGIGGSGFECHRIWIDGKDLNKSYIQKEDRTFEEGNLFDETEQTSPLNIQSIEVWALDAKNISGSTTYLRNTNHSPFSNSQFSMANSSASQASQLNESVINAVLQGINEQKYKGAVERIVEENEEQHDSVKRNGKGH